MGHLAGRRPRERPDDGEERRLAGAVRADDHRTLDRPRTRRSRRRAPAPGRTSSSRRAARRPNLAARIRHERSLPLFRRGGQASAVRWRHLACSTWCAPERPSACPKRLDSGRPCYSRFHDCCARPPRRGASAHPEAAAGRGRGARRQGRGRGARARRAPRARPPPHRGRPRRRQDDARARARAGRRRRAATRAVHERPAPERRRRRLGLRPAQRASSSSARARSSRTSSSPTRSTARARARSPRCSRR